MAQFIQHEARHNQRAFEEPGDAQVGDAASDDRAGIDEDIPLAEVRPGDRLRVRPGEKIPVDGVSIDAVQPEPMSMELGRITELGDNSVRFWSRLHANLGYREEQDTRIQKFYLYQQNQKETGSFPSSMYQKLPSDYQ